MYDYTMICAYLWKNIAIYSASAKLKSRIHNLQFMQIEQDRQYNKKLKSVHDNSTLTMQITHMKATGFHI